MTEELKARIAQINAGTAPAGYKKTKVGIVPEEWEEKKLDDVSMFIRNGFVYSPTTADKGVMITRIETISNRCIDLNCVGYAVPPIDQKYRLIKGDILLSHINSLAHIGKTAIFDLEKEIYHGMNLLCIRANEKISPLYYFYWLNSNSALSRFRAFAKKAINQCSISASEIGMIRFPLPPLPEQQKIAEILTAQDAVIALMQKQIELLQKQKKAFLQKMFPKKGSNVPEIRFEGFTDAWEQRKLGEIYSFQYGEFNNNPDNGGVYPIYGANGIIGGYTEYNAEDSAVIGHMGAYAGYVVWAEGKHFVTYNGTIAKPSDNTTDSKYGFYLLSSKQIYRICAGSGQPFVSYNDLNNIDVVIPKAKEEQRKIGNYFSHLDSLITLHQRKLELEQQKKKALMQLLLTGKVRVKT